MNSGRFFVFEIDEFTIFFSRFSAKLLRQAFGASRNPAEGLRQAFGTSETLLKAYDKLSDFPETLLKAYDKLSELSEALLKVCKAFSELSENISADLLKCLIDSYINKTALNVFHIFNSSFTVGCKCKHISSTSRTAYFHYKFIVFQSLLPEFPYVFRYKLPHVFELEN